MCSMHAPETVAEVLALRARGLGARRISARTGVPIATVTDWLRGRTPRRSANRSCPDCGALERVSAELEPTYAYLLGLYLGDGYIAPHARGVFRLRIKLDERYPGIVAECEVAMQVLVPRNRVGRVVEHGSWIEVSAYSQHWPCLFPQHGAGKKHLRKISLTESQSDFVRRHPGQLLRGLIHSDGCRFVNTGRGGWENPRYSFSNKSADILKIFCDACDLLGLRWTRAGEETIYVSRKADVALLDQFVGPKA